MAVSDPSERWIDPATVTHAQIQDAVLAYWPLMRRTRLAAQDARKLTAGRMRAPIPTEFSDAVDNVENFRVDTPFKYTEPLAIKQALAKKEPAITREPSGIGPRALDAATKVEQACAAVLGRREGGFPWADVVDLSLIEACAAVITMPTEAEMPPALFDADGERTARYRSGTLSDATDAHGRDLERYYLRHPLVSYRPVSILDCAPIFGRHGGRDNVLCGLVVQSLYTESELLRLGFRWDRSRMPLGLLSPVGSAAAEDDPSTAAAAALGDGAPGALRVLWELWAYHAESGCPYVAYSVGGADTRLEAPSERGPAVINLREKYGLARLPISWEWGQSFRSSNPDERAVPYTKPFERGWTSVDTMLTARVIHEWRFGLTGLVEQIDNPDLARVLLEKNVPVDIAARPMQVARVFGRVVPSVPAPGGAGMQQLAAFVLGLTEQETGAELGGSPAESGFAQTVARSYALDARHQVREAARRHYEAAASFTLEILTNLARDHGRAIPIVGNYRVPVSKAPREQASTRDILEFTETLCGDDFEVTAEFPSEFGDNLALQQQAAEFVDRRLKPRRWFHEQTGETSPEVVEAEILSDQMLMSEQGIADTMAMVARIQGDMDKSEALALQASGRAGPDGVPTALLDGLEGLQAGAQAPNGAPPLTGGSTNPAQSSLAGAIGGAMQAGPMQQVGQAGVPAPPLGG